MNNLIDVKENYILRLDSQLLSILLRDNTTGKNIIWATDDYIPYGVNYQKNSPMTIFSITGKNGNLIKPRTEKTKQEQLTRVRDKAEVFTPSWICNKQNNLVDNAWFGIEYVFNAEKENDWVTKNEKVPFPTPTNKTWTDYVKAIRLEIVCGEAPYLASRYDTVNGCPIPLNERIGLLDRKLRVINENTETEEEWYSWAVQAYKSIYGYEWQGDNILIARENLLFTFIDYYKDRFHTEPSHDKLVEIATIISWNIWQMDGLKFVVPDSCKNAPETTYTLLGEETSEQYCEGCRKNNKNKHNGIYCYIMDWEKGKKVKFSTLVKK